jgi:hypothetical protein
MKGNKENRNMEDETTNVKNLRIVNHPLVCILFYSASDATTLMNNVSGVTYEKSEIDVNNGRPPVCHPRSARKSDPHVARLRSWKY